MSFDSNSLINLPWPIGTLNLVAVVRADMPSSQKYIFDTSRLHPNDRTFGFDLCSITHLQINSQQIDRSVSCLTEQACTGDFFALS